MCGLKVLRWERCRLICTLLQEDIPRVYKGRETSVGKQGVMHCEWFKEHETSLPRRFCRCILHIHNGTSESQR